ncbi:mediator of RNA polymerase II transcription subunit 12-like [Dreissena polymorpha]|uniref:Uncharacterized protein n=1 Tax=Dreissena polymorpha TaxID=45954 RepID=A0A9D4ICQ4_DREPO|nr:mediator of RNA polymerase II transcription subunit 12-like [Dreissena polymorpha]KAH3770481.1 hypothetical protein DPMN_171768 [Dreissena polymorpha]
MIRNLFCLFGMVLTTTTAASFRSARDAFNPTQLMEHHMDMRTDDQSIFGAYHPNDLVQSIINFFQNGGHKNSDSQWGLFVYNPNDKMDQYVGNVHAPGGLGSNPNTGQSEINRSQQQPSQAASGFDPSKLNEQLMQSMQSGGFSSYGAPQQQQHSQLQNGGFDADSLNKHLMQNFLHNDASFSKNSATGSSGSQQQVEIGASLLGFNPDSLNAGLLGSMRYDPNSAVLMQPPSFQSNGGVDTDKSNPYSAEQQWGKNADTNPTHPPEATTSNKINLSTASANEDSQQKTGPSENANSPFETTGGNAANAGFSGNANVGGTGGYANLGNGGFTNVVNAGYGAQASAPQLSSNQLHQYGAGTGSSPNGSGSSAVFQPGNFGENVDQNQMIPGVQQGAVLQQTDSKAPQANGIGGMG